MAMAKLQEGVSAENSKLHDQIDEQNKKKRGVPADSEKFLGIPVMYYGGDANKDNVSSFMGSFDKYYKHATNRSKYASNHVNARMFNQLLIMDRTTLSQIQPFIGGRFIFVPGEMPRCMEILHPEETAYVRRLFQSTVMSITGWSERSLETAPVTAMTEQNSYEVVTKQVGKTNSLTFTFMTLLSGLPLYKYITTWMQYIYNAGSSAASYPYFTGLEFHEGNHSMNGVYCVVDPSFQIVEEGALVYAMVPKSNSANTILDQTWGEHNVSQYNVQFKVHTLPGGMPQVLRICQGVLADYVAAVELHDYWVNPANESDPATNLMGLGAGTLYDEGRAAMAEYAEIERGN